MPTPAFCSLDEVYSDWNFKKPKENKQPQIESTQQPSQQQSNHPNIQPIQKQLSNGNHFEKQPEQQEQQDVYIPNNNGIRSFCPNCSNCINANDVLQQRIIEQNIWPRPRWTPQYPDAYGDYDPFNRYWMNNVPQSHREDFGNVFENFGNKKNSTETLLQVILFILIALFIIQLIECLYMRATEE